MSCLFLVLELVCFGTESLPHDLGPPKALPGWPGVHHCLLQLVVMCKTECIHRQRQSQGG